MTQSEAFLAHVEAFLAESGMTATAFSKAVAGDLSFVTDIRNGRKPSLRTVDRVNEYIAEQRQKVAS